MSNISSSPASGPPGASILNGTVDPVNSIGRDGDFYINTTTSTIFGAKYLGVWPYPGVVLKGESIGDLDGGSPTTIYGGVTPIDCGGP
jgi:hypothetical protein